MPAGRSRPRPASPENVYSGLMAPDIISILGVGIALAGLILNGRRQQQRGMEQLRAEFTGLRREVSELDARLSRLEEVVSTLEGVVSTALFNRPSLVESAERSD